MDGDVLGGRLRDDVVVGQDEKVRSAVELHDHAGAGLFHGPRLAVGPVLGLLDRLDRNDRGQHAIDDAFETSAELQQFVALIRSRRRQLGLGGQGAEDRRGVHDDEQGQEAQCAGDDGSFHGEASPRGIRSRAATKQV